MEYLFPLVFLLLQEVLRPILSLLPRCPLYRTARRTVLPVGVMAPMMDQTEGRTTSHTMRIIVFPLPLGGILCRRMVRRIRRIVRTTKEEILYGNVLPERSSQSASRGTGVSWRKDPGLSSSSSSSSSSSNTSPVLLNEDEVATGFRVVVVVVVEEVGSQGWVPLLVVDTRLLRRPTANRIQTPSQPGVPLPPPSFASLRGVSRGTRNSISNLLLTRAIRRPQWVKSSPHPSMFVVKGSRMSRRRDNRIHLNRPCRRPQQPSPPRQGVKLKIQAIV